MTTPILETIVTACQCNVLEPKWLLAPGRRIGNQWKDRINLDGVNTVNLLTETLQSVVLGLVSGETAARGVEYASGFRCEMLVGQVIGEMRQAGQLSYLGRVESIDTLAKLVTKTLADLRLAGMSPNDIQSTKTEDPGKAEDLHRIWTGYDQILAEQNLVDYADCLRMACELLDEGRQHLPADLVVISPTEVTRCHLEEQFIAQLEKRCNFVGPAAPSDEDSEIKFSAEFKAAVGEVNEINLALRQAIQSPNDFPLDRMEILHTDYGTYVPLIHERLTAILDESNNSIDELPVTFAEGLACIYARPGRALRGWLRWLRHDCMQTMMVRMIREGLLEFPSHAAGFGYGSLANRLRKMPIGLRASRYAEVLADAASKARAGIQAFANRSNDSDQPEFSSGYDFGLAGIETLQSLLVPLLEGSPERGDEPLVILDAAREFLKNFARRANRLDQYANAKLLDSIESMFRAIQATPHARFDVWDWLERLPVESRVLASGPQPGRIHVDHLARGGQTGRPNTLIVGLDDSRFPIRASQDPLLLDNERGRLSAELSRSVDGNERLAREYHALLNRLAGQVTFIFSSYSLAQDRAQFPGSMLLDTFRRVTGQPTATLEEFETAVGPAESFCPRSEQAFLTADNWWQSRLAGESDRSQRESAVEAEFPHFAEARKAEEERGRDEFTEYDGHVPAAGKDLDPTRTDARRVSSSRLETFGSCPRKFFFRYGLGIKPPEEHLIDVENWLDPLTIGCVVHEVFEDFLRELSGQGKTPNYQRDRDELHRRLHAQLNSLELTVPVPNPDARQRQVRMLERTCDIFLNKEQDYCETTGSIPWVFEASVGLGEPPNSPLDCDEPIKIQLSDGRTMQVGGRIDRVDRVGGPDSLSFGIWDYKSGSDWGFEKSDPLKQGRKLQPFIYVEMLKHRVRAAFGAEAKAEFFGYFFPSPKTEGRRLEWTTAELSSGDEVLRHICDAIGVGAFIATTDESDCKYCDYRPVCGDPVRTTASSLVQLSTSGDPTLEPVCQLRDISKTSIGEIE